MRTQKTIAQATGSVTAWPTNIVVPPFANRMRCIRTLAVVEFAICLGSLTIATTPARAQQSATQLEEVLVTAQKREENIQDVPLSITALSAEAMAQFGDKGFIDYANNVPNLSFSYGQNGGGDNPQGVSQGRGVTIRGIAGNNTTNFYIDDTPVPVSVDLRVLQLERVEVLRGPQGTLYGSASLGGTVKLVTLKPSESEFSARVEGELYDVADGGIASYGGASANLPLPSANGGLRAAVFSSNEPGFLSRTYNDPLAQNAEGNTTGPAATINHVGSVQATGGLLSGRFAPDSLPGFTIEPGFIWQKTTGEGLRLADNFASNSVQRRVEDVAEGYDDEFVLWSLVLGYKFDFGQMILSGSYFSRDAADTEDGSDITALIFSLDPLVPSTSFSNQHTDQQTYELKFQSEFDGPFGMVAGIFYTYDRSWYDQLILSPGANAASGNTLGTDIAWLDHQPSSGSELAEYANLTYDLGSKLQISAGLRYSDQEGFGGITASGFYAGGEFSNYGSTTHRPLTERYTASYHFTPDVMGYANVASGERAGGGEQNVPPLCDTDLIALGLTPGNVFANPDSVWSYDVGVKMTTADRRATVNIAAFHIDWNAILQTVRLPICGGFVTINSGAATSDGGEIEATFAFNANLTVGLSVGYTDAKISQSATGNPTPVGAPLTGVPDWTASTSLEYTIPTQTAGDLFIRAQYNYTDVRRSFNNAAVVGRILPAYSLVNLRFGSTFRTNMEVSLFARNLLNTHANYGDELAEVVEYPTRPRFVVSTPRQIGLAISYKF